MFKKYIHTNISEITIKGYKVMADFITEEEIDRILDVVEEMDGKYGFNISSIFRLLATAKVKVHNLETDDIDFIYKEYDIKEIIKHLNALKTKIKILESQFV